MGLQLLQNANFNEPGTIADGEYYADETCTGFPEGQHAGYFKQVSYIDSASPRTRGKKAESDDEAEGEEKPKRSRKTKDVRVPLTDIIFFRQEFKGLKNYGDKELINYERFGFPKESLVSGIAYNFKWMRRKKFLYLEDQA